MVTAFEVLDLHTPTELHSTNDTYIPCKVGITI